MGSCLKKAHSLAAKKTFGFPDSESRIGARHVCDSIERGHRRIMATTQISKKRKFVADGVFYAELNEMLMRELAEDGYSGVEVRVTPMRTEIIIRATRTQSVLGEKGRRIRELTGLVQKRWQFAEGSVELYAEKVANRGLCAVAQCESLRYKLIGGLAVRRAAYGVVRFIMESGASHLWRMRAPSALAVRMSSRLACSQFPTIGAMPAATGGRLGTTIAVLAELLCSPPTRRPRHAMLPAQAPRVRRC